MPSDTNVSLKIFEKLSKYKDLEIEVTKMLHLKTTTLPVVIDSLGIVAKTVPYYVLQISGAPCLTELQKIIYIYIYIYIYLYIYIYIYLYIYIPV